MYESCVFLFVWTEGEPESVGSYALFVLRANEKGCKTTALVCSGRVRRGGYTRARNYCNLNYHEAPNGCVPSFVNASCVAETRRGVLF